MSEEILVTKSKKKRTKYPFLEPNVEETQERYSTEDQGSSGVIAREIRVAMREEIKKVKDNEERMQEKLFAFENRKLDEKFFTVRNSLTNSELGNVAKVTLSDQTITHAKGKDTQRHHRKILGGLYHRDDERTTEVEFHRAESEGQ